jgi:hypothetical protein
VDDDDYRAEAERLRLLDPQTRLDLVAMYRHLSRNPKVPAAERQKARKRAQALEKLLGLGKRRRGV